MLGVRREAQSSSFSTLSIFEFKNDWITELREPTTWESGPEKNMMSS